MNLRKNEQGVGGEAGAFFVISEFDLEGIANSRVESNLWENSPEDQENNGFRQKTPPLTAEKMEYLQPDRALKDIINVAHEAIPPYRSPQP